MAFLFSAERETKMTLRLVYFLPHISVCISEHICVSASAIPQSEVLCALSGFVRFLASVCQVLRHNAGSVSDRQVKWVCVCLCVYTVLSIFSSNQFPPNATVGAVSVFNLWSSELSGGRRHGSLPHGRAPFLGTQSLDEG